MNICFFPISSIIGLIIILLTLHCQYYPLAPRREMFLLNSHNSVEHKYKEYDLVSRTLYIYYIVFFIIPVQTERLTGIFLRYQAVIQQLFYLYFLVSGLAVMLHRLQPRLKCPQAILLF